MISSPDLLPFTGPEGFGDSEDGEAEGERGTARGLLPEELSIPPLPSDASGGGHPWSSAAGFRRDFVLVAEFSEEVGPTPVMTIPDEAGASGSLDLNHFSVRIMSVDYQASGPGGPSSSGLRLNFNEDSEVVLGDSADWVFAYVRHMTLLDLSARGMVRPFCMAYVCSSQAKIMDNFGRLSAGFGLAADSLKTGNRQTFSLELHRKLHQLQYKRLALLQDDSMSGAGEQLEAVERAIATHKDLLRQVTSYPNRKLKQPDFLPYEPADVSTDATSIPPPPPPAAHLAGPEGRLKPLQELCSAYFLSLMTEQLAQAEVRLRGDVTALRSAGITRALNRKLRLTNFLFEQPEDDEEEEEEDGEEAVARETGSRPSSESSVEAKEEEMTGSTSSGDSIQVIGTERSYKTLASSAAPVASSLLPGSSDPAPIAVPLATPLAPLDSSLAAVSDPGPRRLRVYVGRTNSEDSIEVLSTTIIAEDLAAISEEEEPIKDDKTDVTAKDARAGSAYQMLPNLPAEPWSWPQSVDEASDGGAETHAPHRTLSSDEAGLRAQRFVKQNSFSRQVVFCLLSGRPLVLLSGDGDKLRKTVDALALFLPAPAGAVMPCLSAPLQLSDLLTWRLIGFHRSASSGPLHWLSRYSRYLAVLDLDQRTLRCQRYSGSLAGSLVGSAVPAGAFLLHVQSGLTALANRALLFTFARRGDEDDVLDDGDLSVMRFLSDLIKRQHAARGPPALRFSYVALHVHKNTTAV